MNSIVVDALIERAKQGKRVMVLSHTQHAARQAFTEIADQATDAHDIRRANGNQRIRYDGGGTIDVRSIQGNGYRGYSADLVYVEREAALTVYREDLLPLVAVSGGEIVRE